MKPPRTLISINRLYVGWFPSEWKNWRVFTDPYGIDLCLGPLGITIVWGKTP